MIFILLSTINQDTMTNIYLIIITHCLYVSTTDQHKYPYPKDWPNSLPRTSTIYGEGDGEPSEPDCTKIFAKRL